MLADCKKFWFILTPTQRRSGFLLLGLMFIGMMLETLGVSLIIPILALMTNNNFVTDYPMVVPWVNRLGSPSHENLIVFAMLSLVGVALLKVLFLAFNFLCFPARSLPVPPNSIASFDSQLDRFL